MSLWLAALLGWIGSRSSGDDAPGARDLRLRPTQVFQPVAKELPAGNAGLFVGINRFTRDRSLQELSFAVHDAVETAYLFSLELKLIPPANCYLCLSGEPQAAAVKDHLAQLERAGAQIRAGDRSEILGALLDVTALAQESTNLLVCSFSSHGFDDRGKPCVMPCDGRRQLLEDTAIPLLTIENRLQESNAGHRLLLVDACQERISARSTGEGSVGQPVTEAFVAALQTPTGQAKFASCSPGEFSFEHASLGGVGHGVFTHEFLQALRGGARADESNLVRLGDVADCVAKNVTAWTTDNKRPKQTPFLQSPVATRNLPLASKADDLVALIAQFERVAADEVLSAELRTGLLEQLKSPSAPTDADRKLLKATRDFLDGRMDKDFFVAFLQYDRKRWSGGVLPVATVPAPAVAATSSTPAENLAPAPAQPAESIAAAASLSQPKPDASTSSTETAPSISSAVKPPANPTLTTPAPTPRARPGLSLKSGRLEFRNDLGALVWSFNGDGDPIKDFVSDTRYHCVFACSERQVFRLSNLDGRVDWKNSHDLAAAFSLLTVDSRIGQVAAVDRAGAKHVFDMANGRYLQSLAAANQTLDRNGVELPPLMSVEDWIFDPAANNLVPSNEGFTLPGSGDAAQDFSGSVVPNPNGVPDPDVWKWTVTVKQPVAAVKVGKQTVAQVKRGDVLTVLQQNEEWFWVEVSIGTEKQKGWISKQDVHNEDFSFRFSDPSGF